MAKTEPELNPTDTEVIPADSKATETVEMFGAKNFAPPAERLPGSKFKQIMHGYWAKKKWTLPLTFILIIGVILSVPASRYPVLGLFLKSDYSVKVIDATTKKPVTNVTLLLGDVTAKTDSKGEARLKSKVGTVNLTATKKYYKASNTAVLVPIKQKGPAYVVSIRATGRQVPIAITNKITGKPISGAVVSASGTEAKTDSQGKLVLVLPADQATVAATITASGFNDAKLTVQVSEQVLPANAVQLVTSGKIYFLSKLSGKIDVVKTNLDGSDRQTVLAGTGKEQNGDTIMLAARDWKYLALKSLRDGGSKAKLFLIDTSTDKLTTIDEGNAFFEAVGWSDHHFVYKVEREEKEIWQPGGQALKSFNAESGKLAVLEETDGEGTGQYDYAFNRFDQVYLLENEVVFYKNWSSGFYNSSKLSGKQIKLTSVKPDGTGKKTIREFPVPENTSYYSIQSSLYAPQELYVQVPPAAGTDNNPTYFEYENGKIAVKNDVTSQQFNSPYPTYLESPSGKQTAWSEDRDGKSIVFIGDKNGEDEKEVASLSEYTPYGWYSDEYILVSKKGSELYIMPTTGGPLLKVTDYHKPEFNFRGYGGGYGGL